MDGNEVDENEEILSPQKGDRLVRSDVRDGVYNACINPTWGDVDHGYTEGYRRGAMLLVEHVIEHQRNQDYLVYPIIFLYRHHIELALKSIILKTAYLIDRPLTESEKKNLGRHRLDLLWQDLKPLLAAVCEAPGWGDIDASEIEGVDNYIRQLSALDPDSFSFRYAKSKKGAPSLPPELKHINLRHFAEMLERLTNYLDGMATGLSVLADGKAEMEFEWRKEMAQYMDYA